jgi:hypothetical protein
LPGAAKRERTELTLDTNFSLQNISCKCFKQRTFFGIVMPSRVYSAAVVGVDAFEVHAWLQLTSLEQLPKPKTANLIATKLDTGNRRDVIRFWRQRWPCPQIRVSTEEQMISSVPDFFAVNRRNLTKRIPALKWLPVQEIGRVIN